MRHRPFSLLLLLCSTFIAGCDSANETTFESSANRHIRSFWSPTGDRIGFTNTDIGSLGMWMVDSNGGNLRLLHSGDIGGGTWSPDGGWVAFYEVGQIKARSTSTDSLRILVSASGSIRPAWGPDGTTLAFIRDGVVTLDIPSGFESLVSTEGTYVQWFPGTQSMLIGVAVAEPSTNAFILRRADVTTHSIQELLTIRTSDDCGFFVPSPDGTTVYFGRKPFDTRSQVWSVNLTTYQLRQLTTDGGDYPAVSPDGQWIVYTRTAPGDGGLWKMRPDGSGEGATDAAIGAATHEENA